MSVEALEAEGLALVTNFEKDIEGVMRPFYQNLKAYAEKVEAAPISTTMKMALFQSAASTLEKIAEVVERVAEEEGMNNE